MNTPVVAASRPSTCTLEQFPFKHLQHAGSSCPSHLPYFVSLFMMFLSFPRGLISYIVNIGARGIRCARWHLIATLTLSVHPLPRIALITPLFLRPGDAQTPVSGNDPLAVSLNMKRTVPVARRRGEYEMRRVGNAKRFDTCSAYYRDATATLLCGQTGI